MQKKSRNKKYKEKVIKYYNDGECENLLSMFKSKDRDAINLGAQVMMDNKMFFPTQHVHILLKALKEAQSEISKTKVSTNSGTVSYTHNPAFDKSTYIDNVIVQLKQISNMHIMVGNKSRANKIWAKMKIIKP